MFIIMSKSRRLGRISTDNPYISADNLTPQKARVLAMLALANNSSEGFARGDDLALTIVHSPTAAERKASASNGAPRGTRTSHEGIVGLVISFHAPEKSIW